MRLEISRILEFSRGPGNFQGMLKVQDPGNFQVPGNFHGCQSWFYMRILLITPTPYNKNWEEWVVARRYIESSCKIGSISIIILKSDKNFHFLRIKWGNWQQIIDQSAKTANLKPLLVDIIASFVNVQIILFILLIIRISYCTFSTGLHDAYWFDPRFFYLLSIWDTGVFVAAAIAAVWSDTGCHNLIETVRCGCHRLF